MEGNIWQSLPSVGVYQTQRPFQSRQRAGNIFGVARQRHQRGAAPAAAAAAAAGVQGRVAQQGLYTRSDFCSTYAYLPPFRST